MWLGLSWNKPVLHQSVRLDAYRSAVTMLETQGLVYPCFCTRQEIAAEIARAPHAPHELNFAIYPGTCRMLSTAE